MLRRLARLAKAPLIGGLRLFAGLALRASRVLEGEAKPFAGKAAGTPQGDQVMFSTELVDALPISVAMRDLEGRFLQVNRTWEKYFQVRREDAIGRRFTELPGWQDGIERSEAARRGEQQDSDLIARGPGAGPMLIERERLGRSYLTSRQLYADADGRIAGILATGIDTTELREAEKALAAERQRLALVVRATQAGIIDWDMATETPWYSERLKEMLGYPADADTSGWPSIFGGLVHPDDRDRCRDVFFSGLVSERAPNSVAVQAPLELRLRHAGGGYVWVQSMGLTLHDEAGGAKRFLAAITDIGERRAQEEALRNQFKFINDLFDSVPLSLAMRDPEGRFLFVNRNWENFTGTRREDVLGILPHDCLPREEADAILAEDRAALARGTGAPVDFTEYKFRDRHLTQMRTVMADDQGKVLGVLVASMDMTERHAIEEALATEQRRLALVVSASRVGTLDWDGDTHAVYYSPRFKEILGYPPDADASAWPGGFDGLLHPEDRERVTGAFRTHVLGTGPEGRTERHAPLEYRLRRADGTYVWVEAQGLSVRDEAGRCKRFTASYADITERRAHDEALRESVRLREEVERMSRHDLKTPLNSVIAVSRLLREGGKLSREDEDLLNIVERAGYRILSMVNLSLDLYRMEQGTYQFHPQAVDMLDAAHKVAADLEGQAASKNVALRLRRSGHTLARAEELLSYSMLANLVKNAVEATPDGGVVSVTVEGAGDSVCVHVHNPGAVPPAIRRRFFDKYASSGKSAGLGLGTYSARLMAQVQEGDITLHTTEAEGTTISVRLGSVLKGATGDGAPAAAAPTSTRAEQLPDLPALKVLVVDDDEFNRLVLRRYLPSPPLTLTMAVNGRAALDAARADWPDVVLLDLEMPVMDGYEAATRLRELEREGRKRLKIVAISSNDDEAIVQRALAAQCDHYLVKPAPRETLFRLLAGDAAGKPEAAAPAAADGLPPQRVGVDPVLADKLPAFLASRRELLAEASAAASAGDRASVRRVAHRLAGGFALYGFSWASAQAQWVERNAPEGALGDLALRLASIVSHLDGVTVEYAPPEDTPSAQGL